MAQVKEIALINIYPSVFFFQELVLLLIRQMFLASCLIFPAPKEYSLDRIAKHLIFIPQDMSDTVQTARTNHERKESKNNEHSKDQRNFSPKDKGLPIQNTLTRIKAPTCLRIKVNKEVHLSKVIIRKITLIKDEKTISLQSRLTKLDRFTVNSVPCVFYSTSQPRSNLLVYFHGNAEDISTCYDFTRSLSLCLGLPLLVVEYPGYSLHEGSTSAQSIQQTVDTVMGYLLGQIGYKLEDISVIGRSIGSGAALYLGVQFKVATVVLISPFLSLCRVATQLYGWAVGGLLREQFNNGEKMQKLRSPCLILHGKDDSLIRAEQALELGELASGYCKVDVIQRMSHSNVSITEIVEKMRAFFRNSGFIRN